MGRNAKHCLLSLRTKDSEPYEPSELITGLTIVLTESSQSETDNVKLSVNLLEQDPQQKSSSYKALCMPKKRETNAIPESLSGTTACQCRRHKRWGFDPWVWMIPWRRKWQPTPVFLSPWTDGNPLQYSCLKNPMDSQTLLQSDTTEAV